MKKLHDMDFGLSVLDVSPVSSGSTGAQALRNTLELARLADQLGYERYWLAEHQSAPSHSYHLTSYAIDRSVWHELCDFAITEF